MNQFLISSLSSSCFLVPLWLSRVATPLSPLVTGLRAPAVSGRNTGPQETSVRNSVRLEDAVLGQCPRHPGEVLSRPHRYVMRVGPSGRRLPHVDPVEFTCRGWGGVEQRMQPMAHTHVLQYNRSYSPKTLHSGTNHVPCNTSTRNTSGQPTGLSQTAHGTNDPQTVQVVPGPLTSESPLTPIPPNRQPLLRC
ncbi:hypothetical protein Bbelb_145310 [Branchiostoma belcheri]|nr:hypothetical protein Bbelb_145310 [Branchiostoma belcheri]